MATSKLKVKKRLRLGKSGAKEIRKEGNVPAILYGNNKDPLPLVVNPAELKKALSTESGKNTLLELEIEGDDEKGRELSLLRDVQVDFLANKPLHVDLQAVDMDKKIDVRVPINISGRAEGTKEGGMLESLIRELYVKCSPDKIPNSIDIDVTPLNIGESIHISDLDLPEGVEPIADEEKTVLTVIMPKGMSTETAVADEDAEEGEESTDTPEEESNDSEAKDDEG